MATMANLQRICAAGYCLPSRPTRFRFSALDLLQLLVVGGIAGGVLVERRHGEFLHDGLGRGVEQRLLEGVIEFLVMSGSMPLGTADAVGRVHRQVDAGLLQGPHLGEQLHALGAPDHQQAELSALHQGNPAAGIGDDLDLAAQQALVELAAAAIGDMGELDAEPLLQVDHHHVLHRRRPERAVVQLAGTGLGGGDELLQRLPRAVGAHDDAVRRAASWMM